MENFSNRKLKKTLEQIADELGVSAKAVFTWRKQSAYDDPLATLKEDAACKSVSEIREQIDALRKLRYNWQSIAEMLGHNILWLNRWRKTNNYIDVLTPISGILLDNLIADYCLTRRENGLNFIIAKIQSLGY